MMKRVGLASVSLLGSLSLVPSLHAQSAAPAAPAAPAPTGTASAAPAEPCPAAAPASAPAPAPAGAASAGAELNSGSDFGLEASSQAAPPDDSDAERRWRATSLHLGSALNGSTGLMHVVEAGAGAPGTFRFTTTGSYFAGQGFLCNSNARCPTFSGESQTANDDVTRAGAHLGLSVTVLPFLEAFAGFHNHATSNNRGRPQLLQVLGDTNFGVKGFLPHSADGIFSFGGEAALWLLNGTGGVGLDGASTSFNIRGLATLDLDNRSQAADRIPLRFHANLGYMVDNSGQIVKTVETTAPPQGRGTPISRIERFGLDINRVDFFQMGFAAEYVHDFVRPFLEWSVDVPVNRQNYTCSVNQANNNGEDCLGRNQGIGTTPSRLSIGARVFPWPEHGLSLLAGFDVGTSGSSTFVQEIAPELPWNFYFAFGYAVDTVAPKPIIERIPAAPPVAAPAREHFIEGVVLEKGTQNAIADAIVKYDGRPLTGMVTGPEGSFRSANLEPGTYTFNVSASGYRDGQCIATVEASSAAAAKPTPGAVVAPGQPGSVAVQVPAGVPAGRTLPPPSAASNGPSVVKLQCELEALPKVGSVIGSVTDPDSNRPVDGAHIEVTDRLNRKLELRADSGGAFRFENVPPGPLKFAVDAPGYFTAVAEVNVRAREESQARMLLNKRPAQPNVVVAGKEIKLKKQVHFQHDSAEILPDSQAILEELAELIAKRPDIKNVEVQGHTDDTGAAAYNLRLSQSRAQAVVDAIASHGVDASRMTAKGYGQEKPLLPNSTEANRAKNRRVQVMITEQGK
jgi:outer membrane protein OmpA-like peptidoglycan-associated protein